MTQGILGYQYAEESSSSGQTAFAGLGLTLDLLQLLRLRSHVEASLQLRDDDQSWPDYVLMMTVILLNLAGASCVDDVEMLASDDGLCRLFEQAILYRVPKKLRKRLKRRMKAVGGRPFPSAPTIRRWLADFDDTPDDARAKQGSATIIAPSEALRGLWRVNDALVADLQARRIERHATLDMDATLIGSKKREALYCYKGFSAYQPFQVWWAEQNLLVHSEFRDGNVPAGFEQLRLLEETLDKLPSSVTSVRMRSDSAGYQVELLKYCAEGSHPRFGVIPFAVASDVTDAFREAVDEVDEADWHRLVRVFEDGTQIETHQQWAEVCFVPGWAGHSKKGPEYRFIAIREPMQNTLPGTESDDESQNALPFPTHVFADQQKYKLFGLVTNLDREQWAGDRVIWWSRKRCGKSEHFHDVVKNDLAGGTLPSGIFGANAAWWAIACITANILTYFQALAVPPKYAKVRLKRLRFRLFHLAGRVCHHARNLIVRLSANHPSLPDLLDIRARIALRARHPPDTA